VLNKFVTVNAGEAQNYDMRHITQMTLAFILTSFSLHKLF